MKLLSSNLFVLVSALALSASAACSSNGGGEAPPGPAVFAPEAASDGAVVCLSPRVSIGDRVVLDVVARGAAQVHGAAFRLTWDPESLAFVSAEGGAAWSKQSVAIAKEGSPGQLAVAWAEKGETGIVDATTDKVLGTLTFDARGRKGTSLGFKVERSTLVDRKGAHLQVTWRGGAVAAR
jgi:hypothetical protein